MIARANALLRSLPEWAVWLAGALPLVVLLADLSTGRLGVDPVRDIEHRLGRSALYFLIATLAVTPLRRLAGINAIRLRRALGLLSLSYASLHLTAWAVLDMGLLWTQMGRDILKRPYLILGMSSFIMLIAMGLTSNRRAIRAMGRNWARLHRLIYPAAVLACLHWLWALKIWGARPLFWAGVILVLLLLRVPLLSGRGRN